MGKTQKLKEELARVIKTVVADTNHEDATEKSSYPYAVYSLTPFNYDDNQTRYQLEINIVDFGQDSTRIDDITDQLESLFDRYHNITPHHQISIYRLSNSTITEADRRFKRKRLLFEVVHHERTA